MNSTDIGGDLRKPGHLVCKCVFLITAIGYLPFVGGHSLPIISTQFDPADLTRYRGDRNWSNIAYFGLYLADIVASYHASCCYH